MLHGKKSDLMGLESHDLPTRFRLELQCCFVVTNTLKEHISKEFHGDTDPTVL